VLPIEDSRIKSINNLYIADCQCGSTLSFKYKDSALKMLGRGSCRNCKKDYRSLNDDKFLIFKNEEGKWCSVCSGCGCEQAYTRKDHAKQSQVADWQCKSCVNLSKRFSKNSSVGSRQRLYNKFKKNSKNRRIEWDITIDEMFSIYNGKCALTSWDICIDYTNCTASLDRIDSSKGYSIHNIQWVHTMVNMCKNKYKLEDFIKMCVSVSKNVNN